MVDSEGDGDIKNELKVNDGKKDLSIDCMISVSAKQVCEILNFLGAQQLESSFLYTCSL